MNIKLVALLLTTSVLAACVASESDSETVVAASSVVKAQSFKGSKFAPPQSDMNFHAGWAITVERPRRILADPCDQQMNPAKIMSECLGQLEAIGNASTFKVSECREGDERDHKWDLLVSPVTCDGYVDTPKLSTNARVVFHKVGEGWKARIASYSREGMEQR